MKHLKHVSRDGRLKARQKYAEGGDVTPLPLEPLGSIARIGQDRYNLENRRDSVTGKFRSAAEGRSLSTTRTDK
jgi:hypothetical protein